jgi:hypothetical protein
MPAMNLPVRSKPDRNRFHLTNSFRKGVTRQLELAISVFGLEVNYTPGTKLTAVREVGRCDRRTLAIWILTPR